MFNGFFTLIHIVLASISSSFSVYIPAHFQQQLISKLYNDFLLNYSYSPILQ